MAELVGAVSALRLPADRDLPWPRRPRDELRPRARLWRQAQSAGAAQAPEKAHRDRPPAPERADGRQPGVDYDFVFDWCANGQQLKCLTVTDEWTKEGLAIEVDGRIRSGRVIEVLSRLVSRARRAALSALGQRPGVRLPRAAEVDRRPGHRDRIDRSGQALAEWRDGELQRQVPRRVPEPRMVPVTGRGEGRDRERGAGTSTVRPHSSLGYLTPAAFAAKLEEQDAAPAQATGRIAAVYGASAPRPVAQPSRKGQTKAATGVVVSS